MAGSRPHGVGAQADAAALQGQQRFFQRGQRAAEPLHLLALDRAAVARLEDGVGQAGVEQLGLHLLFGLHVVDFLLVPHAEQRRLGHVDVAAFDQVVHLAVEERQQQRADVRAVDVGVGHDDDLAVAAFGEVHFVADARADGRDHAADLLVGQHFVFARLVGVDDLAAQGEDGLVLADAAAFGAAAGRIALDQVQFARVDLAAGAVAELAGQAAAAQGALALADELPGLAGAFAGLGRQQALLHDDLGRLGILFQVLGQVVADGRVDDAFDLAVAQLGLGLAFELRLGHAERDDGRQALAAVVAAGGQVLVQVRLLAVGVDACGSWRRGSRRRACRLRSC